MKDLSFEQVDNVRCDLISLYGEICLYKDVNIDQSIGDFLSSEEKEEQFKDVTMSNGIQVIDFFKRVVAKFHMDNDALLAEFFMRLISVVVMLNEEYGVDQRVHA